MSSVIDQVIVKRLLGEHYFAVSEMLVAWIAKEIYIDELEDILEELGEEYANKIIKELR